MSQDKKEQTEQFEGEGDGGMVGAFRRLLSGSSGESEPDVQKEFRVTELFRRAVDRGSELRDSTEDSLKRAIVDLMTTSETIELLLVKLDELRTDASHAIRDEIESFLRELDLGNELRKALDGLSVEIKTEVTFRDRSTETTNQSSSDEKA